MRAAGASSTVEKHAEHAPSKPLAESAAKPGHKQHRGSLDLSEEDMRELDPSLHPACRDLLHIKQGLKHHLDKGDITDQVANQYGKNAFKCA
jgi:hypothetical protein